MEIIDEHGELCAFYSDDPQDFIHIQPVEAIRLLTRTMIDFWLFTKKPRKTATKNSRSTRIVGFQYQVVKVL